MRGARSTARPREMLFEYREARFRVVSTYREAPTWGWVPEVEEIDQAGQPIVDGRGWEIATASDARFDTPYECFASAARMIGEFVDGELDGR